MSGTVRVKVHQFDGGTKYEQGCKEGNEQNASQVT